MAIKNPFSHVSDPSRPRKSAFDLSYDVKLTADFSFLYPVCFDEAVPGDVWHIGASQVVRFNPLVAPIYHEVNVFVHYFFVPYRLLDDNWETFITGGRTGDDASSVPTYPFAAYFAKDTSQPARPNLADYFGFPQDLNDGRASPIDQAYWDALPLKPIDYPRRAYYFVYSQYYWDENVGQDLPYVRDDLTFDPSQLPDTEGLLERRSWVKDYLTSSLPFQQRGTAPALSVAGSKTFPFDINVPGQVVRVAAQNPTGNTYDDPKDLPILLRMPGISNPPSPPPRLPGVFYPFPHQGLASPFYTIASTNYQSDNPPSGSRYGVAYPLSSANVPYTTPQDVNADGTFLHWPGTYDPMPISPSTTLKTEFVGGYYYLPYNTQIGNTAGFSQSGSVTIDFGDSFGFDVADLRMVFQVQKWLERNARAGVRYVEFLRAHYAAFPRDERLQRPEYIGGARHQIVISEVLQTGESDVTPQGTFTGHGMTVSGEFCGKYRVHEHGMILGLLSIMPVPAYEDRLDRQWIKRSRYDFYFPEFAHLSEQGVYNAEVRWNAEAKPADGSLSWDEDIFGFQGRWDELRHKHNLVTGKMRQSVADGNFSQWHMARHWRNGTHVALNSDFLLTGFNESVGAKRTLFAADEPAFLVDHCNHLKVIRPMPVQASPGLVDHF